MAFAGFEGVEVEFYGFGGVSPSYGEGGSGGDGGVVAEDAFVFANVDLTEGYGGAGFGSGSGRAAVEGFVEGARGHYGLDGFGFDGLGIGANEDGGSGIVDGRRGEREAENVG